MIFIISGDIEKFRSAQEAYKILSDSDQRQQYDNGTLNSNGDSFGSSSDWETNAREEFSKVFFNIFGSGQSRTRPPPKPKKTRDVVLSLGVKLEDIYCGKTFSVKIDRYASQLG